MYIPLKPLFSRHKGIGVQFTDEPTGNLDSHSSQNVIDTICKINQELRKTVLLVTHDPQIASYADRIIFLKDGVILDELKKGESQEAFYRETLERMADL